MSTTNSIALDISTLAAECNKNAAAVGLCHIVDVSGPVKQQCNTYLSKIFLSFLFFKHFDIILFILIFLLSFFATTNQPSLQKIIFI